MMQTHGLPPQYQGMGMPMTGAMMGGYPRPMGMTMGSYPRPMGMMTGMGAYPQPMAAGMGMMPRTMSMAGGMTGMGMMPRPYLQKTNDKTEPKLQKTHTTETDSTFGWVAVTLVVLIITLSLAYGYFALKQ